MIAIRHWMLYFPLEFVLPTESYLPITVTHLLHIHGINSTIKLFWKHLHTKPTSFFLWFAKVLAKRYHVTHIFTKVEDSVAASTFNWINGWFCWTLYHFSNEFEVSFWRKEGGSKRSIEVESHCFDIGYFSFIADFISI